MFAKTIKALTVSFFIGILLYVNWGRHPSEKTGFTVYPAAKIDTKGMTPIEKNVIVVDEFGQEYESTWPKRARGLVKNGRARFISENKICLVCPPNTELEDMTMSDKINVMESTTPAAAEPAYTVEYIFTKMEEIAKQTSQLTAAVQSLAQEGGDAAVSKMDALNDMVKQREETNRRMLDVYEKMYDKLTEQSLTDRLTEVAAWLKTLNRAGYDDACWQVLMNAAASQMCR